MLTEAQIKKFKARLNLNKDKGSPALFAILSAPNRFRILKLLCWHSPLCPTDISMILNLSISAVSHQCKILLMAGLVEKERMGKMICYKINNDSQQVKLMKQILKQ